MAQGLWWWDACERAELSLSRARSLRLPPPPCVSDRVAACPVGAWLRALCMCHVVPRRPAACGGLRVKREQHTQVCEKRPLSSRKNLMWSSSDADAAARQDECIISSRWEQRCQTDDEGKLRCEALKRKWRLCPGQQPVEIERSTSKEENPQELNGVFTSPWPRAFGGADAPSRGPGMHPLPPPDLGGMFQQMDQLFSALFFGDTTPYMHARPRAAPPGEWPQGADPPATGGRNGPVVGEV